MSDRDPVGALVRLLDGMVEHGDRPVGVRELARHLGLSPSSVQRTLESARNASLVTSTGDAKWNIGWEMFRLSSHVVRRNPFVTCQDQLDALSARFDETAVLTVLDLGRSQRMYVAAGESTRPVRFVPQLYTWLPALAGATGLAIAAHLEPEQRARLHAATAGERRPDRLADADAFEAVCATVRSDGVAISENEVDLGACSIAVPVDARVGLHCAVGLIVPQQRWTPPDAATVRTITRTAAQIAARVDDRSTR